MILESALEDFPGSLRGQLLLPNHLGYEEARKVHNAMIDRCPAMIVRCAGSRLVNRAKPGLEAA